jgi:hypothetical protein
MTQGASEPQPDWWDDELDDLVQDCVAVFGEAAVDDTVVRLTERHCAIDADDVPVPDALVPILVDALKAECRRLLTPH